MENLLSGLNGAQLSAVTNEAAVLQVLAPPGSGKTKTLTSRVGYLISNNGLQPRNIIVCTFTVKAAREMEERIASYLGKDLASKLILGTFHSISRRFLAVYGKLIDMDEKYGIADSSDSMSILTRIIKRHKFSIAPAQARARISSSKSQGVNAEQFAHTSKKADQQEVAIVYSEYEDHLKVSNLLDFDDLLVQCVKLLRQFPSCVANVEAVLIDEFQDTNSIQYDLMQLFAQCKQAITIVGDPDQSIYGWRNAEILNLKKMQRQYPDTCVVKLEENYRSSGAILLSAQEVIEQDQSRPSKKLLPTHSVGMRPVLRKLPNAAVEASWIVSEIKRTSALTGKLFKYSDYAILLRSASLSRHIESALGREGIPYRMVGGHKFFDRLEVKLVLDYLRVLNHPDHNDALARILNVPSRKVGDVTIQRLLEECDEKRITLWRLVLGVAQGRLKPSIPVSSQGQRGLELFTNLMLTTWKKLREVSQGNGPLDSFLVHVINKIDLEEYLRKTKPEEFDSRWANVQELVTQAADFSTISKQSASSELHGDSWGLQEAEEAEPLTTEEILTRFLANVSLSTELQKGNDEQGHMEQVIVSTIHAAKGLEWPVVFIPAAYEGSIPHSRAEDTDEERRLLYVAMTRAQSLLYLSNPQKNSTGERTKLSPFLSQRPMETYFDRSGPVFDFTVAAELAGILRRPVPDRNMVEQGFLTIERIRDDRWPTGDENDADEERNTIARDGRADACYQGRSSGAGGVYTSRKQSDLSVSTTLDNRSEFSTSTTTLSTSFMSAATVLTSLNQGNLNKVDGGGTTPSHTALVVPKKRKADQREIKSQQGIDRFFMNAVSKPAALESGARGVVTSPPHKRTGAKWSGLGDDAVQHESHEPCEQRFDAVAENEDQRSRVVIFDDKKPGPSLHRTIIQLVNAASQRKTLGVRRSLNGWAERNARKTGSANTPGA